MSHANTALLCNLVQGTILHIDSKERREAPILNRPGREDSGARAVETPGRRENDRTNTHQVYEPLLVIGVDKFANVDSEC